MSQTRISLDTMKPAGLTRRAQFGLVALLATAALAGTLRLGDAAAGARVLRDAAVEQGAGAGEAIDGEAWARRAVEATAALDAWRASQWTGSTGGVIAAEIQRAFTDEARALNLDVRTIRVEPSAVEINGVSAIRFSFTGDVQRAEQAARFIADLSARQPAIIVSELTYTVARDSSGRLSMEGYAPVVIADAAAGEEAR